MMSRMSHTERDTQSRSSLFDRLAAISRQRHSAVGDMTSTNTSDSPGVAFVTMLLLLLIPGHRRKTPYCTADADGIFSAENSAVTAAAVDDDEGAQTPEIGRDHVIECHVIGRSQWGRPVRSRSAQSQSSDVVTAMQQQRCMSRGGSTRLARVQLIYTLKMATRNSTDRPT